MIPSEAWRRERSAALVKLLALTPGSRLHREQVMDRFWPDLDPDAAGANLRKAVHFARRTLGEHEVIESSEVIALASDVELVVDVRAFEEAAKLALAGSDAAACERAADLYRGELLPDDRYVEWLEEPRKQLQQRYVRVLRAGKLWERLIAIDPTDEQAQCALMQAALDAGRRGEAIRLFQALRERLRVDLGIGPSKAAVALHDRALATPALQPVDLVDRIRASLAWGLVHLHSGEPEKAERVARDTRELALGAGLGREMGEATALLGMVAHMQGRWSALFREEVVEWVRAAPAFTSNVFDGHICFAQFCMASPDGHDQVVTAARELLALAEQAGSIPGRGLAKFMLGALALCAGRLVEAEQLLLEAEQHHAETGAVAGSVLVLEQLAQLALARGDKASARELIRQAAAIMNTTWLAPHLRIRIKALEVMAAETSEDVLRAIQEGDGLLSAGTLCQPCSMGFRTVSAIALAEAGQLEQVSRRLDEAERLAGMWNGGPWVAAIWEARGVLRRAQGNDARALAGLSEAAARYAELGRPLDHARCLSRIAGH
ncbi:MAG: BTAD domain-containing putative transcriptional regulator [Myxococcales bacterium]